MTNAPRIGEDLGSFLSAYAPADLARVLGALAKAALPVAHLVRGGRLAWGFKATVDPALGGCAQNALDEFSDATFIDGLKGSGARGVLSETREDPVALDANGKFLVAIDPLDSSSNIDVNISFGAIFAVFDAFPGKPKIAHFLQAGATQRAAGFVIYGPHVDFVFTIGAGVHVATLTPDSNVFRISRLDARIPAQSGEFAINAANSRHWPEAVRAYIDDCLEGDEGPRGRNFDMRWVGSMVADAYRILTRGGVYLCPGESREGHANGRARLIDQANPIAFIVEQAGGAAIDGFDRILEIAPTSLRMRTPLIFGAKDKVERIARYFSEGGATANSSPLFGKRGLLRRQT